MIKGVEYFLATATADAVPSYFRERAAGNMDGSVDDRPALLVLGGLDGRLDHTFANINTALQYVDRLRIILINDHSAAEVLPAHELSIELDPNYEGDTCGLVPISGPTTAKTFGLVYNCDGLVLQMGALISTSNSVTSGMERVTIEASLPVLWSLTRCGAKGAASPDAPIHRAARQKY